MHSYDQQYITDSNTRAPKLTDTSTESTEGIKNFLPNATIWNTGNIASAAGDVNYNYYPAVQEVSPRERLLQRACSKAMFNGDSGPMHRSAIPETRRLITEDAKRWAIDIHSTSSIFWLKGSVGTGKSAIARRICEELDAEDPRLLAGSFFFWRNDNDRNSLKAFVSTIAYRIYIVMPEVGKLINSVLSNDPSILDSTIEYQWNALIVKPLCQASTLDGVGQRSLIVIDGLDECEPSSSQRQVLHLIVAFQEHNLSRRLPF
ncbi:hypothetical protein AX16_008389 [Volvariella volvacea WC 439]|nr:hypothetical protein AX16_008389 [Volvariella volvacea WC 439]